MQDTRMLSVISRLGLCLLFGGSGCVMDAGQEDGVADEAASDGAASDVEGSALELVAQDPNVPYFASVTANGTGCPRGTWAANIDPKGETFTLTFSAYETMVEPGQLIKVKDCQIAVQLHSPQGLSYSIGDFFYKGYAFLDRSGMTATQTAGYYFQGNPVDAVSARTDLRGAFDAEYLFQDTIGIADLVWSPCGTDRLLNVPTRIIVKNNSSKTGTGYLNTLSVDGSLQLVFRLHWRRC